jgi:hypothetical protein
MFGLRTTHNELSSVAAVVYHTARNLLVVHETTLNTTLSHRVRCVQIIKVEAHPIPEHMRARRVVGRAALVGECFTRESS